MSPEEIVKVAYQALLARDPDPNAQAGSDLVRSSQDIKCFLEGIVASDEFGRKHNIIQPRQLPNLTQVIPFVMRLARKTVVSYRLYSRRIKIATSI
jgi:hypothetical protein